MISKKQAVLITAYKNYEYLIQLSIKLNKFFDVYIHIDKKSEEIQEFEIFELKKYCSEVISEYSIFWGSFNHINAIIALLKCAKKNNYVYYHIISGEDIPCRSIDSFASFFNSNGNNYLSFVEVGDSEWRDRFKYYYLLVNKNPHTRLYAIINGALLRIQKVLNVKRTGLGKEKK